MTQTIDHPTTPGWQAPPPPPPGPKAWYKKRWVWAVSALAVIIIAASGSGTDKTDVAQEGVVAASDQPAATAPTTAAPATTAPTSAPVKVVTPTTAKPTPTTVAVSSCKQVREALLTGSQTQIDAAMRRLIADKSADDTAREYADYYMTRDAPGSYMSKDMREMDVGLIRSSCS